jgi:hypothetical protein
VSRTGQSARLLPLEGGLNFRDLGGYPAEEAMLTSLKTSHGGVLPFLEAELGVGRGAVKMLRETLLEET